MVYHQREFYRNYHRHDDYRTRGIDWVTAAAWMTIVVLVAAFWVWVMVLIGY